MPDKQLGEVYGLFQDIATFLLEIYERFKAYYDEFVELNDL